MRNGQVRPTALGAIQLSLCVFSLASIAILIPIAEYQIYRHLRRHHRKAFERLAIPSPSFLWREERDAESAAFEEFFSSGTHVVLQDPQLNALRLTLLESDQQPTTVGFEFDEPLPSDLLGNF